MRLNNRGQITVFLCLSMSAMLLISIAALEGVRVYMARSKANISAKCAANSIMADYNSELFRRYHMLVIDVDYGGRGEAYLEEKAEEYLEYNLNNNGLASVVGLGGNFYDYNIEDVALGDTVKLWDENLQVFKSEIEDYSKTVGLVDGSELLIDRISKGVSGEYSEEDSSKISSDKELTDIDIQEEEATDPRKTIETSTKNGLLSYVLPKDVSPSREKIETKDLPSKTKNYVEEDLTIDTTFENNENINKVLNRDNHIENVATDEICAYMYALSCFSRLGNELEEDSRLKYEMEYIIAGKDNDYDNLEIIANRLLLVRYPICVAKVMKDEKKKAAALVVASAIGLLTTTEGAIETYQNIILYAWAYIDALDDVRDIMNGEAVDKLYYEDYLVGMLLLEVDKDKKYYRMLDIMEMNIKLIEEDFEIENCAYGVEINGEISFKPMFATSIDNSNYRCFFEESRSY